MNEQENLDDFKEYLIDVVEFYRDEYNTENEDYYNELIEEITNTDNLDQLEMYSKQTDGWLDY